MKKNNVNDIIFYDTEERGINMNYNKKIKFFRAIIGILIFIFIIFCAYFIYSNFFVNNNVTQVGKLEPKTEEQYITLENEFDKIFSSKLDIENYDDSGIIKEDSTKEIVYAYINGQKNSPNNYDLDIHIPYININNENAKKINKEIEEYKFKCAEILKSKNKNIVYNIDFCAYIDGDLLSIIIRSNLKEGVNAQKLNIKTYNYNLKTNQKVSFREILKEKEVAEDYAQEKINKKISEEQKRTEEMEALGINVYKRNIQNDIYKVQNVIEYFMYKGNLYIIFAYGNTEATIEKDIVVL